MVLFLICIWIVIGIHSQIHRKGFRRKKKPEQPDRVGYRNRKKAPWVIKEVIRLAALMPDAGYRKIAGTFNRIHVGRESVGKTFVSYTLRANAYEVRQLRKRYQHRIPRPLPRNLIWGMDFTFITDSTGVSHPVLGIIDHGSRMALLIQRLENKSSAAILRALANVIEICGKPKIIRTDNESCFGSWIIRVGLWLLRIKQQKIERGCPWMNGRIERLFLTFKQVLPAFVEDAKSLRINIAIFQFWYNCVRQHQHLADKTPADVWSGRKVIRNAVAYYFRHEKMQGFYLPPG